jgi:rhamnogalacturonan endolyase
LARTPWIDVRPWGNDGNRYNRNMMSPAYLDGRKASIVITRGGNSRDEVQAYDYHDGKLTKRWTWFVANGGGNYGHNVRAADIDGDGRDEFLFFNVAIDDDGSRVLWNTKEAHGDRFHLSDIDPDRPGLEVFYIQEFADTYMHPVSMRDARTGDLLWGPTGDWGDVGRGLCANVDARYRGMECWAVGNSPLYDAQGSDRGPRPNTPNMAIFWDADRERELIGGTTISKWNGNGLQTRMSASGCAVGTRDIPMGYADILGDWREEAWWLCAGNTELRVYVPTDVAPSRMYTLMQDPEYRIGVGEMTQGYVQSPHTSFYIGSDMSPPPAPRLAIPPGT